MHPKNSRFKRSQTSSTLSAKLVTIIASLNQMNPITRPIFYLMNQLSYRNKFVLLASLFAIPLILFAGRLAYTYHMEVNQVNLTRTGLSYLKVGTDLIQDLETLRDLSVIASAQSESILTKKIEPVKQSALKHIKTIQTYALPEKHRFFISELEDLITHKGFIRGNKASIESAYEQTHAIISRTYSWRTKLSYTYISRSKSSTDILDILSLLNESEIYLHSLGQMRAFGSIYLEQKFVDSYASSVLEQTYSKFSKLIDLIDTKAEEYQNLFLLYPEIRPKTIRKDLASALEHFYQALIEPYMPSGDLVTFYEGMTDTYEQANIKNQQLLQLLDQVLALEYQDSIHRLAYFYLAVSLMIMLISYIYLGLYTSMNTAIRSLMRSARKVASGSYHDPIQTQTKDELSSVAQAMDSMRLSIQEREEKLAFMGQTDGLTKLYNRQYFDSALELSLANSLRQHTPFSLVMIDIDHFKSINDTYGHQTGDECLRQVARLIQAQYQRITDVVARYGGEEFIAILYGSDLEEAIQQTETLRSTIETCAIKSDGLSIQLTASFGLASLSSPTMSTSSDLIALADALLYQSKHTGRNRISAALYSDSQAKVSTPSNNLAE